MIRKIIHPIIYIPIFLFIISQKAILGNTKSSVDEFIEEKEKLVG